MKSKVLSALALLTSLASLATAQTYNASPQIIPIQNDGNIGTTLNLLAKLNAVGQAVTISVTDTTGIIGVVGQGAGTSGYAGIVAIGQVACAFDGPTFAGDYAQASTTLAGACHDVGGTFPLKGTVVGRVLATNTIPGFYNVFVFPAEIHGAQIDGGGIYTLPQATNATLGGVTIPALSGLSVTGGALGVVYGHTAFTSLQGNDPLIAGALQDPGANGLVKRTSMGTTSIATAGDLPPGYPYSLLSSVPLLVNQLAQVAGNSQVQRPKLNFVGGLNVNVVGTDNGVDTTNIIISSTSPASVSNVSVGSLPSWLVGSFANGTSTPVLNIAMATGQLSHQVLATCGNLTLFAPCNLQVSDLPSGYLYSALSGIPTLYNQQVQVGGASFVQRNKLNFSGSTNLQVLASDNGTDTTTLTFTPVGLSNGTLTNFYVAGLPTWLSSSVVTPTTTPGLTLSAAVGQTPHQVIGTCGTSTVFAPCVLQASDLPLPVLYNQITEANGLVLTQRNKVNYVAGNNISIVPSDNGVDTTTLTLNSLVPALYNQTAEANGNPVAQRSKVNFVAGNNVTVVPTDNGIDTSTFTINSTAAGNVTSLGTPIVPTWLTATVTAPTTVPVITLASAAGQSSHQVIGTCGSATSFSPCSLSLSDLPLDVVGQPAFSQSFTAQTSVLIAHNFNTQNVITQCFDASNTQIFPGTLVVTDSNDVTATFLAPQTGRCVVNGQVGPSGSSATPFSAITPGISIGNALNIGAGSTLGPINGGVITANAYSGAVQGNGSKVQLSSGTFVAGDCVKADAFGNTVDAGAACGSGTGTGTGAGVTQIVLNGGTALTGAVSLVVSTPDTYTVGATGITVGNTVSSDATANEAIRSPWPSPCNSFGVAQASVSIGGSVLVRTIGVLNVLTDAAIPAGELVTCSPSVNGQVHDTGQILQSKVLSTTPILGVVMTPSTAAGQTAGVRWYPSGTFGSSILHSFGATMTAGTNALSIGAISYVTVPYACTITGWGVTTDTGTAAFDIWRTHISSTVKPVVGNTITGGFYPVNSASGAPTQSTTLTNWVLPVANGDLFALQLRALTGTPTNAVLTVNCQ